MFKSFWYRAGARHFREGRPIEHADAMFRGMVDCRAARLWRRGWTAEKEKTKC